MCQIFDLCPSGLQNFHIIHLWCSLSLNGSFVSDYRILFYFVSCSFSLQSENHISCTLKISNIFFPACSTLAVPKSDKLLFHLPATIRACFIAVAHIYSHSFCPAFYKLNQNFNLILYIHFLLHFWTFCPEVNFLLLFLRFPPEC